VSFDEYLIKKKIDRAAFQKADPQRFEIWQNLFGKISEQSFTVQKLYLINAIRRKFPLAHVEDPDKPSTLAPTKSKPVVRPRPKIK
jgi:hypothetical protein